MSGVAREDKVSSPVTLLKVNNRSLSEASMVPAYETEGLEQVISRPSVPCSQPEWDCLLPRVSLDSPSIKWMEWADTEEVAGKSSSF